MFLLIEGWLYVNTQDEDNFYLFSPEYGDILSYSCMVATTDWDVREKITPQWAILGREIFYDILQDQLCSSL